MHPEPPSEERPRVTEAAVATQVENAREVARTLLARPAGPTTGQPDNSLVGNALLGSTDTSTTAARSYDLLLADFQESMRRLCADMQLPEQIGTTVTEIGAALFAMLGHHTKTENELAVQTVLSALREFGVMISLDQEDELLVDEQDEATATNALGRAVAAQLSGSEIFQRKEMTSTTQLCVRLHKFLRTRKPAWAVMSRRIFPVDKPLPSIDGGFENLFSSVINAKTRTELIRTTSAKFYVALKETNAAASRHAFASAMSAASFVVQVMNNEPAAALKRAASTTNRVIRSISDRADTPRAMTADEAFDLLVCHFCPPTVQKECWISSAFWYRKQFSPAKMGDLKNRRQATSSNELMLLCMYFPLTFLTLMF